MQGCLTKINAAKKNEHDALERISLMEQPLSQKTLVKSQLRWAENVQKLGMEEALESKRQQENTSELCFRGNKSTNSSFIDKTSHEVRNPLSAVVQCADSIITSLTEMLALQNVSPELRSLIDDSFDAVHTILSRAQHQKY